MEINININEVSISGVINVRIQSGSVKTKIFPCTQATKAGVP